VSPALPAEILVDPANRWIALVQPAAELANRIADTEFVPAEMRGKPAVVAAAILYGSELGLAPMMSLAKIDVVKGRPAPRAELARALALAAGHELWVEETTNTRVVLKGRRRGQDHVFTVTWTLDDVKKAGISSHMYAKYPRQMLLARASAELVRQMAPDVLGGIAQFAEEIDAGETAPADDTPTAPADPKPPARTARRRQQPTPDPEPTADPGRPPRADDTTSTAEPAPDPITDAQKRKLMAVFGDLGIRDRGDRLAFVAAACRPVDSSTDLSKAEAATVIDAAEAVAQGRLQIVTADDGTITLVTTDDDRPPLPGEDDMAPLDHGRSS
jgi:hypothetical protein